MALLYRIQHTQGIKTTYEPSSIPPDALWEARNVRADEEGLLRIRGGVTQNGASLGNGTVQALYEAFEHMLMVWEQQLYFVDSTAKTKTKIASTVIGATSSDPVKIIRWTRSGAEMCYLFGGNGVFQTDKATCALLTPYTPATGEPVNLIRNTDGTHNVNSGPAKCKFAVVRKSISQRMAAAGNPNSPNTVYVTAPLDATYWPANQTVQLPDDGGKITGLANWNNALVIFRDKDVWAFFGTDVTAADAKLVLQDTSVGCQAERSIVDVTGIGLVFLGPDNIYAMQDLVGIENRMKATPLGDDVRKYLAKAISDGVAGVHAIYANREYRLCFPNGVEPERIFRLSLLHQPSWYMDTTPKTSQYCYHNNQLYGAGNRVGLLYQFDDTATNDNGIMIPMSITFRREDLGAGPARIRRIFIYTIGTQTIQDFALSVLSDGGLVEVREFNVGASGVPDFTIGVSSIGTGGFGRMQAVQVFEARFTPSLKGQFVQLRLTSTQKDQDIAILGYGIDYQPASRPRGDRKGVVVSP